MPTNDKKINLYNRRLLSLTSIKDNFLDYLIDTIHDMAQSMFVFSSGILDGESIGLNNNSGGDTFDLDLTNASKVLVASGDIIDLANITGSSITDAIAFENTASATYYVGIRYQEIPFGIETNASTGDPEYPSWKQTYGEKNYPDSVADNTTSIRVTINSITESGVDHSGRTVKVWMVDPVSLVEGTAYWEGTSEYLAPNNYVDIPYSGADGPLGQDTSVNPPSTTNTDYEVFIEGASWKKNTDLSANSTYAFLGTITGGTPPTFNAASQELLFTNSLDTSYDGPTGSGSGRTINVDAGAVELSTATNTGDTHKAQLRLTRHAATGNAEFHLEVVTSADQEGTLLAILEPVQDPGGGLKTLEDTEAVTLHASIDGRIDFDRVNINLEDASLRIDQKMHIVLLEGTTSDDGLYSIETIGANYLVVSDRAAGAAPTGWVHSDTGTATVLVPRFVLGQHNPVASALTDHLEFWKGSLFVLCDGQRDVKPLRFIPNLLDSGTGDVIEYYDNFNDPGGWKPYPRVATRLSINSDGSQTWKFGEYGSAIDSMTGERFIRAGVTFKTFVYGSGSADDHAINIKPQDLSLEGWRKPNVRSVGLFNNQGFEQYRWEACGRLAKQVAFFEDDFNRHNANILDGYISTGTGTAQGPTGAENITGGFLVLDTSTDPDASLDATGPYVIASKPTSAATIIYSRTVYFFARFNVYANDTGTEFQKAEYFCGLKTNDDAKIGLHYKTVTDTESSWNFVTEQGGTQTTTSAGLSNIHEEGNDNTWIMFWFRFSLDSESVEFSINGAVESSLSIYNPTHEDWKGLFAPYLLAAQHGGSANSKEIILDYWATWDNRIKSSDPE